MDQWTPDEIGELVSRVYGLGTGIVVGGFLLAGWYVWCRWGKRKDSGD